MNLFRSFQPAASAPVARERLQILLEYDRKLGSQIDLFAVLREEILAVISRHILDPEKVQVTVDRGAKFSTLGVNIEIPNPGGKAQTLPTDCPVLRRDKTAGTRGLRVNRGPMMRGATAAPGSLALPIWLVGATVGAILLAVKRAGSVPLITVGLIAALVLGVLLYAQQSDVGKRRALDDRETALMAGFEEPGRGRRRGNRAVGRFAEDACPGNGGVTTARCGRPRAGLAIRRGHWKRHVVAARAAAGRYRAGLAIRHGYWEHDVAAARAAGCRRRAGLAIRRGHSPSHAGKRYVAADQAGHGTIARAAGRKCHAVAATPTASDPHCDAAACGLLSCVASSARGPVRRTVPKDLPLMPSFRRRFSVSVEEQRCGLTLATTVGTVDRYILHQRGREWRPLSVQLR
jgi:cell division topological specificity factor